LGRSYDIEYSIDSFIGERILEAGVVEESDNSYHTTIVTNNSLSFDSSSFCDSCRAEFWKYGFTEGTSPEKLYLKRAGFGTERQLENKLSRVLGYKNYKEIVAIEYSTKGRAASIAVDQGVWQVRKLGRTLKDAVKEALETYSRQLEYQRSTSRSPDEMSDEEWYDYMEGISSDPLWKETVREQRKSRGIK